MRIFLTCWLVFVLHFATNTVREIYPALSLGDHLSFDVSEYLGFHPDLFAVPGGAGYINNNPGASILGAIPYAITRPVIDRVVAWQQHLRAADPAAPDRDYDTIYPMARDFHRQARERGLDVKFGLAAAVMQALCMAPLSALSAVVMFHILAGLTVSVRRAAALACLYAFATPVFYRTAQLNQNLLVSDCALFAFALLWRPWADPREVRPGHYLAAGLLSGWAVVCDYSGVVVAAVMGLYALTRWLAQPAAERSLRPMAGFVGGVLASGTVLMGYQWWCFGNPFYPAQRYMPPATYTHLGYVGMDWPSADLLWATAFNLRYGLFLSAPLLLLALYPPAWISRRIRLIGAREAGFIALFCGLFFLFCSANQYGRMQFNSGVRHVVPVAPFLFLIAAGVLLRLRTATAVSVAIITGYWSWCLAMYRDVEQGLGVLESPIHVSLEGLRLPWLTTLSHMGYVPQASPIPLLLLSAALIWTLWRVGVPRALRRARPAPGRAARGVATTPAGGWRAISLACLAVALGPRTAAAQSGPTLAFSTYLGGVAEDTIRDIVTDAQGNVYLTGGTASADFPVTARAYDVTHNGDMDVFVVKLAPSGQILWATFLGGPNYDRAYAIELDSSNNVVVAGRAGAGFPTTAGVVQPAFAGDTTPNALYGPQDGFIAKLSADGRRLLWATYWGSDDDCIIRDIAIDGADNLYPAACIDAGHVSQHITPGVFQPARAGGRDGLVAKLNPTATQVEWCSYLGGSANDSATPSIRADGTGVYYATQTSSVDAPTTAGAYARTAAGGTDMYVAKIATDGTSLLWATYLGGTADEFSETHGLALDAQQNVYVAATTTSANFPTTAGVVQPGYGGAGGSGSGASTNYPGDGFVAKLSADGRQLLASTYVGGSLGEGIEGVSVSPAGSVLVSGATFSPDFPLAPDAFQSTNRGNGDLFAIALSSDLRTTLYATLLGGTGEDFGRTSYQDDRGAFLVAGATQSDNWPTLGAAQSARRGDWDGVVAKLATATPGACPSAAPIASPLLVLSRLDKPGESQLRFQGEFDLGAAFPGLGSAFPGARIVLEDLGLGGATALTVDVGPGAPPNACGPRDGWTMSGHAAPRFSFRSLTDSATDPTGQVCLGAGSLRGVTTVKLTQLGSAIKFRVAGRHGRYAAVGPLRAVLILGAGEGSSAEAQGYCGAVAFAVDAAPQPSCKVTVENGTTTRIRCR